MIRTRKNETAEPKKKAATRSKSKAKPKAKPKPKAKRAAAAKPKPDTATAASGQSKRGMHPNQDRTGDRKLEVESVIQALRQTANIKTAAAELLQCSRTTLYAFIAEHPEVEDAALQVQEELLDLSESQVIKALRSGDMQTVRWYMELKGKERGYVRRVENTGKGGGPIETRQKPDLSKLTDDEVEILLAAAERREQTAPAGE